MKLSSEEENFLIYWSAHRLEEKKVFRKLALGLPIGLVMVIAIFINFFSPWYKKAVMVRNQAVQQSNGSLILVLLIAGLLIIAFFIVFSVYHKWDINEVRYKELLAKKDIGSHQNTEGS